ncbi:MAG TPA: DNRLRE domain-containing protein [Frankiaceae bacterium]|nr:DNRLRE domain-containing protein [Frankiaceae bacterium]
MPARADDDPPVEAPAVAPLPGTEVVERRTAYAKTFTTAVPGELRSEIHARPIHFLDGSGHWADIDTSLVPGTDGRYHAKANSIALDVPATSVGPLATVSVDPDHSVGFGLVGAAAVPAAVDGTSVAFANLRSGVSLRLDSRYRGVKEDLVLASPLSPSTFVFPLYLEGLTARLDSEGNVVYSDASGTERARTPHGRMWDSAVDPRSGDPAMSDGVTYALLPTGPTGVALQVTADPLWLASPARQYPVTVDPSVYTASTDDTYVEYPYNNDFSTDTLLKSGTYDGGAHKSRSFIHFPGINALDGKVISSANVQIFENWAFSCTGRDVSLKRVTQSWTGTGLHTFPGWTVGDLIDTVNTARGYTSCANGPAYVTFDATAAMRNWASNAWTNYGLAITASETDSYAWKKWDSTQAANDPRMNVTWSEPNRAPGQVTGRTITPSTCVGTCTYTTTNDATPVLTGTASDADADVLRYDFEVYAGILSTVDASGNATPGSAARVAYGSVSNKASGTQAAWTVTPALADGSYSYRVRVHDGTTYGLWSSGWARFMVDASAPAAPALSSSTHQTSGSWQDASSLAFAWSATSESGIAGYSYVLDQVSSTVPDTVSEGTGTSISYTQPDGMWYFHVRAQNKAGGWGATATFQAGTDTAAPGAVSNLASSDHTPNLPSADATISFSWGAATDTPSGVAGYSWVVNNSAAAAADATIETTATSATTASLGDGTWWVHVRAVDRAGNYGPDVATGPFPVDGAGPLAPIVSSLTHAENAWASARSATFSWTTPTDATAVTGFSVSFDATATSDPDTVVDTVLRTWTQANITDGEHWLHVRGVDAAGNWGATAHYRVRVDGTAPALPALSAAPHTDQAAWYRSRTPSVTAVVTDISQITGYSFTVDKIPNGTPDGTVDTTSNVIPLGPLADGLWYVHVAALNGASLWGPAATYSFQVDGTAPATVASVTSPTHDTVDETNQQDVRVDWTPVTDATSGLVGYTYAFDSSATWVPDTTAETTGTTAAAELTDGTWYFHVAGVDQALNVGTVTTFGPIRIAATAPEVGATATSRFLALWVPRVDDAEFATAYLSTPDYSSQILAEGFHALNDAQKTYLAGKLYDAFQYRIDEQGNSEPAYLATIRDSLYRYVFDKGTLIGLTAAPNQLIATVTQLIDSVVAAVPQELTDAIDPSIVDHVEDMLPDVPLPDAVDELVEPEIDEVLDPDLSDVPSALSDVVRDTMNEVDALVEDNYPQVVAQVNQVVADAGLQPVADAVYATAALLPISPFYTVCWESATSQGCAQNNVVGTPAAVDTTGDGTLDETVTFRAGDVDATAPTELPFVVEAHRRTGSDRDGTTLPAHVWVSYDVPLAGQRFLIGVDGYRLAPTLPGTADVEYRFRNLDTLTAGKPNGRYLLTTSDPGARTAITFGVHELNQSTPNTIEGSVQLTPAPASLRGTVDLDDATDAAGTRTNDVHITATLPVGAPQVAVDARLVLDRERESKRVTHHAVVDKLPSGTTDVKVTRTTTSAGREGLTVTHTAAAPIDRTSYELVMTDGNVKRTVTADVRGLPVATTWHAHWGGGGGVDGDYTGGPLSRLALALTRDTGTTRELTIAARATSLPGTVMFDYGTSADKKVTTVNYAGTGPTGTLAFAYYDRAKVLTLAGSLSQVPPTVTVKFSKTDKSGSVDTDGVIGSLDATFTIDGGRIYRPANVQHVTVQVATANNVTGLGISAKATGMRSIAGDFGDVSTVDGSFAPGGQRLLLVGRVDALYALADFTGVPPTFDAMLDWPALHAHYSASGVAPQVSLYFAKRPGGPIVDLKLTDVPTDVDVTGTLGADPSVTYGANARMTAARVMFSSDATPTDGTGTTFNGTFGDLPTSVHAELHPNAKSFSATAPGVIGSTLVTFSRNRGKAEVPAGEHATMYISGTKDAGSIRLRNLKSISGAFDTNGTTTATVDVSSGGRPFAVSAAVNALRITANVSALPTHTSFTLDQKTHVRWEASSAVPSLSFYKTTTGTGPTLWVSGKTVPRTIDVTGSTSPTYHVVYDAEGTGRAAELKATFAPAYLNGPNPPTTGRYGSIVVHDMPNHVVADVKADVSHVDWNADGTADDLSFKVRGLPTTSFLGSGKIVGVPRHWDADRSGTVIGVHAYDNELGTVDVGFSNDGEIKTRSGYHARFHATKFGGKFNVHVKVAHATNVDINLANGLTAHAAVDLRGSSFVLDVDAYGAVPGSTGATTDEFRFYANGTISDLPTDVTITATSGTITWDANEQLNANLEVRIGWTPAVAAADTPAKPYGIGITDGSATKSGTCRPNLGFKLTDSDNCFGLRVKWSYDGLGKRVTVTLPLSTGGIDLDDMLPRTSKPKFTAHVSMKHLAKLEADVTQEAIPAHANLHFGPFVTKAVPGSPVQLHIATSHSANLGSLHGWVRFPGAVLDFAGVRMSDIQVDVMASSTPRVFDLTVEHGTPLTAKVRLSSSVFRIRAVAKANTTASGVTRASSALLELTHLPATPDDPIELRLDQPTEAEKAASGDPNPQKPVAELHSEPCPSSSSGSGESMDGHANDSKHSGIAIPVIHFTAPAEGMIIVATESGPIAQAAGKAEARDVSVVLRDLGKQLDMTLFAKNGKTTMTSHQGAVGQIWIQATFGLTVPCHNFSLSKIEAGPARIYVNGRYDIKIDSATATLTLNNVTDLTLDAGSSYLAYRLSGNYGSAELALSNLSMKSDSFIHVKAAKSFAEWMRDWYNKSIPIKGTYTSLNPSIYQERLTKEDIGVYIETNLATACVALVGRPIYAGYSENGVRFRNGETAVFSVLSGFLATKDEDENDLQAFITAAMAAALSPGEHELDKDLRANC